MDEWKITITDENHTKLHAATEEYQGLFESDDELTIFALRKIRKLFNLRGFLNLADRNAPETAILWKRADDDAWEVIGHLTYDAVY